MLVSCKTKNQDSAAAGKPGVNLTARKPAPGGVHFPKTRKGFIGCFPEYFEAETDLMV